MEATVARLTKQLETEKERNRKITAGTEKVTKKIAELNEQIDELKQANTQLEADKEAIKMSIAQQKLE